MTSPHRLQVKIYTKEGQITEEVLIQQFHSWIQKDVLDEIPIDVADYSHVVEGPGVLLITHEADYAFDEVGGPGLRYVRKKDVPATLEQTVMLSYTHVLKAAKRLETETSDSDRPIRFETSALELTFLDRRLYPNAEQTGLAVCTSLEKLFSPLFGEVYGAHIPLSKDPRLPFSLRIRARQPISLDSLLESAERISLHQSSLAA